MAPFGAVPRPTPVPILDLQSHMQFHIAASNKGRKRTGAVKTRSLDPLPGHTPHQPRWCLHADFESAVDLNTTGEVHIHLC